MNEAKTVAVACETAEGLAGDISSHFGHTPCFVVAEISGGEILSSRTVSSPGHGEGCSMPGFVHQLGVSAVVVGGIGGGAVSGLEARGIQVVAGASGNAGAALQAFAKGVLVGGEPGCNDHAHHGHGCGHRHGPGGG
jgi:predicted Fe-Mo cluster-binding NifX family protein